MFCKICNKWAGFFKTEHEECRKKLEEIKKEKLELLDEILETDNDELGKMEGIDFSMVGLIPLLKKDVILYRNTGSSLYKTEKKTHYVGGSKGVNIRIMKGVNYRVGAHKGERQETEIWCYKGKGDFYFSTLGIYFKGSSENFKLRYEKMIGIDMCKEGIIISKETVNARQILITIDDYEVKEKIYNVLCKLSQG